MLSEVLVYVRHGCEGGDGFYARIARGHEKSEGGGGAVPGSVGGAFTEGWGNTQRGGECAACADRAGFVFEEGNARSFVGVVAGISGREAGDVKAHHREARA
ncbi:MAG: hypothetical protein AAF411_31865, partial [Myxococcota bacterium]